MLMKILWLTNISLPEASQLMSEKSSPFGGWYVSMSTALAQQDNVELSIAYPKNGLNEILVLKGNKKTFYGFPPVYEKALKSEKKYVHLKKIIDNVRPDLVHIFGTEYAHTLAMVNICQVQNIKVVISIQGLTSICARHYMSGLPVSVQNKFTFRDFIKQDNLKQQQRKFIKRGILEIEALQKVNHIIGRTTWDKACVSQINPKVHYYFCNETLRDEFYKHTWDINKCEKHSIFVSQGSYPIKGLHFMIEALSLILKNFPDAKLYVGGYDITKTETLKDRLKISSYGKYIRELIGRYGLQNNIVFTGLLDEKQMCEQYLKSHVFVCPSSIENSPNSLGEAMILGVPCVASDVGGVSDMLKHKEEGFVYQTDAPYMLSHYIFEVFEDEYLALRLSEKARKHALNTHNRGKNTKKMLAIYGEIFTSGI